MIKFHHIHFRCGMLLSVLMYSAVSSCGELVPNDPIEYQRLLEDVHNGMTKEKTLNDVTLKLQYQPPELRALIDANGRSESYIESLKHYEDQMSFVLIVGSKEEEQDILAKDLQGLEEYQRRVLLLNFEIKDYITLEAGNIRMKPVLGTMENTYGLSTGRKLILVFAGNPEDVLQGNSEFDIIFNDPVFGTGINRFRYNTSDILDAPIPQT